jgi:arylsulfatase A-like enzyme
MSTSWKPCRPRKAVTFIEQHQQEPFFLYYPTASVHGPITPGKRFAGQSQAGSYGEYVQEFDWAVGEVLEALDRRQLSKNTIVVVTSDNGGIVRMGTPHGHRTCGPWRGEKGTAWEGGHRVPFLVRWPGQVPAGTESSEVICHVDLMATLCGALRIRLPGNAGPDSWNVLPAWLGQPTDRPIREATVCVSQQASVFSLRQGPWKLLVSSPSSGAKQAIAVEPELYNLADDPAESRNLAAEQPQKVLELSALLTRIRAQGHSRPGWQVAVP